MITNKRAIILLITLTVIRIFMAMALIYGFPEKGNYAGGYFYLGDEDEYFKSAFSLAQFRPVDSYRTLGFPILLLPFIWLTKISSFERLFLPVGIFYGCVLAPISIILVALIAKRLTKDWKVALFSATIWTFFPYLVYIFVHTDTLFCKDVPAMRMAHQMWVQALSDPPSTLLVLLAIYAFLIEHPIFTGIFFGLATLVRPLNVGVVTLFLFFYLYKRRLKSLFLFIGSSFFVVLPQFIYNWYFYGSPIKFTTAFAMERSNAIEFSHLIGRPVEAFSISNYFFFFQQIILKFPPILLLFFSLIFLVIIYTLFRLYQESTRAAVILILWIFPYFLTYGSSYDLYNSILHFLMPVIPALIIIISIASKKFSKFLLPNE